MQSNKLKQDKALEFILSGKAIFTIVSGKTGNRFTFKSTRSEIDKNLYNIGLVTSSDNNCFAPFAIMKTSDDCLPEIKRHYRSWISNEAPSMVAFKYVINRLFCDILMEGVDIWHEGRCGRCGRLLTVPDSIEFGYGPECLNKIFTQLV